jgi:hypothetical protein
MSFAHERLDFVPSIFVFGLGFEIFVKAFFLVPNNLGNKKKKIRHISLDLKILKDLTVHSFSFVLKVFLINLVFLSCFFILFFRKHNFCNMYS